MTHFHVHADGHSWLMTADENLARAAARSNASRVRRCQSRKHEAAMRRLWAYPIPRYRNLNRQQSLEEIQKRLAEGQRRVAVAVQEEEATP